MREAEFKQAIVGLPIARSEYFSSIGSTNDVVASWAEHGASGLCLACADEQTSGRGRAGRSWFTPSGSALAFSLLLDLEKVLNTEQLGLISGLGALAVCEAFEKLYRLSPKIKWPNDVLLEGKKVCGVLAESKWSGEKMQALILGIGINVAAESVPPKKELNFPATCIEEVIGEKAEIAKLLRGVLVSLIAWKDRMNEPNFVKSWDKRLAYKGEHVSLGDSEPFVEGEVLGLVKDGGVKLRLKNGSERLFHMGEIQIRPLSAKTLN